MCAGFESFDPLRTAAARSTLGASRRESPIVCANYSSRRPPAAIALAYALLVSGGIVTQEPVCDRGLERRATGPLGYRRRGDRCEGVYVQQVGGTALVVASFTESFEDYRPNATGSPLTVEWTPLNGEQVTLRAEGLRRDLYYRMDATRPAAPNSYRWPSDVLAARKILKPDLGVLGWTRQSIGGVTRNVYLPLRIAQRGAPASSAVYELVLFPSVALKEVYVTISQLNAAGPAPRMGSGPTPPRRRLLSGHR